MTGEASSLQHWLRLTHLPGIGGQTQRKLLKEFGLPERVFAADRAALSRVIGDRLAAVLTETDNSAAVRDALAWLQSDPAHDIVTLGDNHYPAALLEIPDPPSLLYVKGRGELLQKPAIAIVGSRNPSPQGLHTATAFAEALAGAGFAIASGLALGIDAAAHRGALAAGGDTVAFVGTGIDRVYPSRNHDLALQIAREGCIVSEFPLGTPPTAGNFPRRNRLISGIARGVLVVEAAPESGSLITARLAAEQGREVFAIPGSIHAVQSRGCHALIKQGAKLVEAVGDILDELAWPRSTTVAASEVVANVAADIDPILQSIGFDPCSLDELAERSGLTIDVLSSRILQLELEGRIAGLPGGRIQRLA